MKKIIPVLVVSLLVIGATILWISGSEFSLPTAEIVQFIVIFLLVGFGIYVAINRLRSVRRGEPAEDELSKRILQKASSLSYYISLYLWVAMIYIKDRITVDTEVLLGSGILGMAVIWAVLVIWFKVRGLKNA
jgi:peptidoglycan/LPS O-acetylase OafA/YrhL